MMANITQSVNKGTTDPSQISLGEDEEMHALPVIFTESIGKEVLSKIPFTLFSRTS